MFMSYTYCLGVLGGGLLLRRFSQVIGNNRLREILLMARLIEADEALASGLVSEVAESHEALMARAGELAQRIASHAPLTLRATKEGLRRISEAAPVDDRDLIALCYMSEDFKEGMEAFLSKRRPSWKGK